MGCLKNNNYQQLADVFKAVYFSSGNCWFLVLRWPDVMAGHSTWDHQAMMRNVFLPCWPAAQKPSKTWMATFIFWKRPTQTQKSGVKNMNQKESNWSGDLISKRRANMILGPLCSIYCWGSDCHPWHHEDRLPSCCFVRKNGLPKPRSGCLGWSWMCWSWQNLTERLMMCKVWCEKWPAVWTQASNSINMS